MGCIIRGGKRHGDQKRKVFGLCKLERTYPVRYTGDYLGRDYLGDESVEAGRSDASLEDARDSGCIFGSDHSHDLWGYGMV